MTAPHLHLDLRRVSGPFLVLVLTLAAVAPGTGPVAAEPSDIPKWWPTQGLWHEAQVIAPGEALEDLPQFLAYGSNMVIDDDTLIVTTQSTKWNDLWVYCPGSGRPHHFPQYTDGCDWIYVYERDKDGRWEQTAKLIPENATTGDTFGWAVDLDEESGVIVAGNPGSKADTNMVHIFERQENRSWLETATIHKEYPEVPPETYTDFGTSVAVSGHTVAAADALGPNASTFVFEKIDGQWIETAVVAGGGGAQGIALAEDTLVTHIWWWEDWDCSPRGLLRLALQIYERTDDVWAPTAFIDPQAEQGYRQQTAPTRIALTEDGTRLIAGAAVDLRLFGVHTEHCLSIHAPYPIGRVHQSTATGLAGAFGAAWIYELIDGEWRLTADIPNPMPHPQTPVFGAAVDIDAGRAVIGAHGDLYNGGPRAGAAYIYENIGDDWHLQGRLRNHDNDPGDYLGKSVGVSGTDVVVGAPENGRVGSVHLFRIIVNVEDSEWP